jgi:hypothetical protein
MTSAAHNPVVVTIKRPAKKRVVAPKKPAPAGIVPLTDARVSSFYHNKKNSCKSRKIAFDLTKAQVKELMQIEFCAYTGIKLTRTGSDNVRLPTDLTLERVDCDEGYTVDNTIVVCLAANSVKAALETHFRSKANSVIHGISETLKRIEARDCPVVEIKRTTVQKVVLWVAKRVGL